METWEPRHCISGMNKKQPENNSSDTLNCYAGEPFQRFSGCHRLLVILVTAQYLHSYIYFILSSSFSISVFIPITIR